MDRFCAFCGASLADTDNLPGPVAASAADERESTRGRAEGPVETAAASTADPAPGTDAVALAAIRQAYRNGEVEVGVDMTAARTWVQQGADVPPGARAVSYALLQGVTFVGLPMFLYLAWPALGWIALPLAIPFLLAQYLMSPIAARAFPQLGVLYWGALAAAAVGVLSAQPFLFWLGLSIAGPATCTHWLYSHASATARSRILSDPQVLAMFSAAGAVDIRPARAETNG